MLSKKNGEKAHKRTEPHTPVWESTVEPESNASRNGVYFFALVLFCVVVGVGLAVQYQNITTLGLIISLLIGLLAIITIRIVPQWERAIVLRFGRYNRTVGPGIYLTIPFIEHVSAHVDQRIIATTFYAEEALTEDLVPVDVDAVLFWMVWNPTKACLEVQNYREAVLRSAQTALRDAIGCVELSELSYRRKQLDADVQEFMDEKLNEWGVSISSVEIRNIYIPRELQHALSKQAQAKRERESRITLAEAERDISELYVEAANIYKDNDLAVKIRSMNLVNEGVKEKGGMVVVPSAYTEGFNAVEQLVHGEK